MKGRPAQPRDPLDDVRPWQYGQRPASDGEGGLDPQAAGAVVLSAGRNGARSVRGLGIDTRCRSTDRAAFRRHRTRSSIRCLCASPARRCRALLPPARCVAVAGQPWYATVARSRGRSERRPSNPGRRTRRAGLPGGSSLSRRARRQGRARRRARRLRRSSILDRCARRDPRGAGNPAQDILRIRP